MRTFGCVLVVLLSIAAIACEGKKDPLVPDNPNADPLMMEGGAPPASSGEAK